MNVAIPEARNEDLWALQATQASAAPSFHVLQYKYVPDILEKRTPFREAHLSKAGEQVTAMAG